MPLGWVVKRGLKKVALVQREGGVMRKDVVVVVDVEEGQRSGQLMYKDHRGQEPLLLMEVIASEG